MKEKKGLSLFGKVTIGNVVLGVVLLLITLGVTMKYSIKSLELKMDESLMGTCIMLANSPMVIEVLESEQISDILNQYLDGVIASTEDMVITVADENAKRFYHPYKDRIGESFVGGDESRVLQGQSYISEAVGTMGLQRRAFVPVYGSGRQQIGFVMVSTKMTKIDNMRTEIYSLYGKMAVILFWFALTIAVILSENIKRSLLGYEPTQFTQIFLAREEVLDALEEGIISIDREGRILLANHSAASMLDIPRGEMIHKSINAVIPSIKLSEIVHNGQALHNKDLITPRFTILYDKIPIREGDQIIGAVAILRNKTEATRLAEQLTGSKHIISALRANTHEFMNKLHIILGMMQMGKVDEASSYITDISRDHWQTMSPVLQKLQNPTVAALILGKLSHMRELNIDLTLLPNSALPPHSNFLSSNQLVTIIGNLMENAIESINVKEDGELRRIVLQILEDDLGLMISVDDTGTGMDAQEVTEVFTQGYSTKGENRGTGMWLVKEILDGCQGSIEIESEKNAGTCITVSIRKPRHGKEGRNQGG